MEPSTFETMGSSIISYGFVLVDGMHVIGDSAFVWGCDILS